MLNKVKYEERILYEIRSLPEEALPKVLRLLSLISEEFVTLEIESEIDEEEIDHVKTRQLLSTSPGNWAKDVIADREDRI